jgi:hypothetical protein
MRVSGNTPVPLTRTAVQSAKPRKKAYKLADGGGLFLAIMPNGSRYLRYKYRFHGKEKLLAPGVYPAVCLLESREKRLAAYKILQNRIDPAAQKQDGKRLSRQKTLSRVWRKSGQYLRTWVTFITKCAKQVVIASAATQSRRAQDSDMYELLRRLCRLAMTPSL